MFPLLLLLPISSVHTVGIVDFLVSSVNQSVDPCHDFFAFACNTEVNKIEKLQKIVDNRIIGSLYQNITDQTRVTNKARVLFQQCSNRRRLAEEGPKVLLRQLERITRLSIYNHDQLDLTNLTIEAWRLMGLRPWFSFDVGNSSLPVIKIAYPEPFLKNVGDKDVREKREIKEKYVDFLTTLFMWYVEDLHLPTEEEEVRQQVRKAVEFEERLFALTNDSYQISDPGNATTLAGLQQEFPLVDIEKLLKWFGSEEGQAVIDRHLAVELHVDEDYFRRLTDLLRTSSEYTLKTYIIVMTARAQTFRLTGKYWQLKNDFMQKVLGGVGVWPFPTREDACLNITQSLFPQLTARTYVENFFSEDVRKSAREILNNLISTFHSILQEAVWMDSTTKDYALFKLESMGREVGYMDRIMNDSYLAESHRLIDIREEDDFETNVERILAYTLRQQLDNLVDSDKEMTPVATSVDAFNFKEVNHIAVPAVLLQPPFYHPFWPMVINYAGLGYTVGHEIAHSFDTEGMLHGLNGQLESWWTKESLAEYGTRTQCFVDQYSHFLIPEVNRTVDGARTLNENLADNIGIRMAFRAYKQAHSEPRLSPQVTNDQLFFIMATQMDCQPYKASELNKFMDQEDHAVPRARINLPLANFPEFAKTFNCPKNSAMNPEKRCRIF